MDYIAQFILEKILPFLSDWSIWILVWLAALYFLLKLIAELDNLWKSKYQSYYYKIKYRNNLQGNRRVRFAKYIIEEITKLDRLEEWSDYRFAELEAEVEAEDRWWSTNNLLSIKRKRVGLHKEKSLSMALRKSSEKLILLEGDPGSGKSVALRHLTRKMAEDASKNAYPYSVIPLYINLRGLERRHSCKIDSNLIREYILLSLNRVNDRDVEIFLEKEFTKGLQENTWLFLFDSFDEIPEILSSTEADKLTVEYAKAIENFMSGMNDCRAIVASRLFRGPSQTSWPQFRILPLTEEKQQTLIKKAELDPDKEKILLGSLPNSNDDVQRMSSNPMFLGLLCDHVRVGGMFPQNSHSVFESYITTRLRHDEKRLYNRFKLDISQVRNIAEKIAFSMTADQMIGLSPTRGELVKALERQYFNLDDEIYRILDALEYLKIGRSETSNIVGDDRQFSFSHRRFQEYFTTCVVLQEPYRVPVEHLLGDARWRETCVTLLYSRSVNANKPIIDQAEKELTAILQQMRSWESDYKIIFNWPEKCLHTIKLLQDGLNDQINSVPHSLRKLIEQIIIIPYENGILLDRKLALEISVLIPDEVFTQLIVSTLKSPSSWLENVAYKQLAKVRMLVHEVESAIRNMMLRMFLSDELWQKKETVYTQVSRLPNAKVYQNLHNELLVAYVIRVAFNVVVIFLFVFAIFGVDMLNSFYFGMLMGVGIFDLFLNRLFPRFASGYFKTQEDFSTIAVLFLMFIVIFVSNIVTVFISSTSAQIDLGSLALGYLLAITTYILMWPFAAFLLIYSTEKYAHPKYWAWAPPLLIFHTILLPLYENVNQISLVSILKALKKVLQFIGGVFVVCSMFLLIFLVETGVIPLETVRSVILWGLSLFVIGFFFGLFYLLCKNIREFGVVEMISRFVRGQKEFFYDIYYDTLVRPVKKRRNRVDDERKYQEFISRFNPHINVYELLDLISNSKRGRAYAVLQRVKNENLLDVDLETVIVLRLLSHDIEEAANFRRSHYKRYMIVSSYYSMHGKEVPKRYVDWIEEFEEKYPLSLGSVFYFDFLDDLNKLIEHIEFSVEKTNPNFVKHSDFLNHN